jgi:hypothetical protein
MAGQSGYAGRYRHPDEGLRSARVPVLELQQRGLLGPRAQPLKHRYQIYIKDVTFGSWIIQAEDEDKARAIADARLVDGDTSWHSGPPGDDGYIEIVEIERVE